MVFVFSRWLNLKFQNLRKSHIYACLPKLIPSFILDFRLPTHSLETIFRNFNFSLPKHTHFRPRKLVLVLAQYFIC
jgi:hypothetical protein